MLPLAVVGNVNVDLIMGPATPWPVPGTEVMLDHHELRIGGSAGNTALAWQGLGVPFVIAANTGNDAFGEWLARDFGDQGKLWPVEKTGTTISVGMTHPNGERTFFTSPGHLPEMAWDGIRQILEQAKLKDGILLLCGCFLTHRIAASYEALFDWADQNTMAVALDTGWPLEGWTDVNIKRIRSWIARSSYVLFNEIEGRAITGEEKIEAVLAGLIALMPKDGVAVIKAGPEGAYAASRDGGQHRARAPSVTVVDTIGAGDVFNAAFLLDLALGRNIGQALRTGVETASLVISTNPRRYDAAEPLARAS